MYALIDDTTGATIRTAECITDLFEASEAGDDEIARAIADCIETGRAPIGGGAAPLVWLVDWREG